jgi:putative hemolysin
METILDQRPFSLNGALRLTPFQPLNGLIEGIIENVFSLRRLDRVYQDLADARGTTEFVQQFIDAFHVRYETAAGELAHIPATGGAVIVANHPFGAIEAAIMAKLLLTIRPDVRIMANYLLNRIPQLQDLLISVDPFGGATATRKNTQPLREAIRWVKEGGLLMVFPAGAVSHVHLSKAKVIDPQWSPTIARIIRMTEAPVTPVYIHGSNSLMFQLLGLVHPRFRTLMIPRELINKAQSTIPIRIGAPIHFSKLKAYDRDEDMATYLRLRTYLLGGQTPRADLAKADLSTPNLQRATVEPIAEGPSPSLLAAEIEALPENQCLVKSGAMGVYYATAEQIPWLLREIGRLREVTFRGVGEGTGKPTDIDLFDAHYLHLFLWNGGSRELVGAYRLGLADEIVNRFGKKGLYTHSLFKYKHRLLDHLNPAIELGRSFIRAEYQRNFSSLLLLWKGIGQFIVRHPHYRVLFGPVTISNEYQLLSRELLVDYLRANRFQPQLARHVKPRHPFRCRVRPLWDRSELTRLEADLEGFSDLLAQVEQNDRRGVPILLKQYLKLGGRLLGFSVDNQFNDALDGLIMVDLRETHPKVLQRYLGQEEAERYLAYHRGMMHASR